jgi:hypothetical protein
LVYLLGDYKKQKNYSKTVKILTMHKTHHPKADLNRLYVKTKG